MAGKVFTVFGPRGGCGKTMIATNLAVSMAMARPGKVCLLDLSLTFGHCAMVLKVAPKFSLAQADPGALAKADQEALDEILGDHPSSLRLLMGSAIPEEGDMVT